MQTTELQTGQNLLKLKHGAGGYYFTLTEKNGNVKLGEAKKKAIKEALTESWIGAVYETTKGDIIKTLLNGNTLYLTKNKETNSYYFL